MKKPHTWRYPYVLLPFRHLRLQQTPLEGSVISFPEPFLVAE